VIEEHELVRLGTEEGDMAAAEGAVAVDAPVALGPSFDLALGIREQSERRPNDWPAIRARDM
jgi:hypothetical protein